MLRCQTLNPAQLFTALQAAHGEQSSVSLTFSSEGKWHILRLSLEGVTEERIFLSGVSERVERYQPVGICLTSGHYKYLFDTQVLDTETGEAKDTITVEYPGTCECMPRRAYLRQPVPQTLHVKVLFWHRGYVDCSDREPAEQYWQGRLLNLSAGGAQFEIENDRKQYFSSGQLLGVQFTPMSYQKPVLLESHVKYLRDDPENGHFKIGVEFLGLETPEGRQCLHRLLDVIDEYERMNSAQKSAS